MSFEFHHPNYYKKQKEEAHKHLSEVQLQDLKDRGIAKKEILKWKIGHCTQGEYASRIVWCCFCERITGFD